MQLIKAYIKEKLGSYCSKVNKNTQNQLELNSQEPANEQFSDTISASPRHTNTLNLCLRTPSFPCFQHLTVTAKAKSNETGCFFFSWAHNSSSGMELLYFSAHLELFKSETALWTKAHVIGVDSRNSWVRLWLLLCHIIQLPFKVNKSSAYWLFRAGCMISSNTIYRGLILYFSLPITKAKSAQWSCL